MTQNRFYLRLALESGRIFKGMGIGAVLEAPVHGEVVFNTAMTGYQEIFSDPSYAGQMVVMTYPLMGNYGIFPEAFESDRFHARAVILHRLCAEAGHPGASASLEAELQRQGVAGITGLDTRALVRYLRDLGTMRAVLARSDVVSAEEQVALARTSPSVSEQDLVASVAQSDLAIPYCDIEANCRTSKELGPRIVVMNYGVKRSQMRELAQRGAEVIVMRHDADLAQVLEQDPAGVLLSSGPGDPQRLPQAASLVRGLLQTGVPLLGICLGHQILGLAAGATTSRLRFGHHGANHPVRDLNNRRVFITSQNHQFQLDEGSIPAASGWYVSDKNLHDGSVEGLRHRVLPAFGVQYHPEGGPGPRDRIPVFDEFISLCRGDKRQIYFPTAEICGRKVQEKPACVLVIGSGPVIIGQAAEFDYAGTQACRALREEGVKVVLVNSNPATIMTDDSSADVVYIEPLTVDSLREIIIREKPDGLLATLGGQTALNLAVALDEAGILQRFGVRLLGTAIETIRTAEDRELFKAAMQHLGEPVPESASVKSWDEAQAFEAMNPLPLVVRPAFTLGGTGGGICASKEEFAERVHAGLAASPIGQVLIERSLAGWRELEYEVVRDSAGTCISICNMENIDPMGVHTGDSIVVAPSQTLTDREHQLLRSAALRIISALNIAGGCNVQFAMAPDSSAYYVIEVNPRVSRSSALASKATGYPIARVAAKIAIGLKLQEITNAVTGKTSAAFEPALDYCVVKIPRWPFDKFPSADRRLGTQMKSTGEVMAIGRNFAAAMNKAIRGLEQKLPQEKQLDNPELLSTPNDLRLLAVLRALHKGQVAPTLAQRSGYGLWFVRQLQEMVACEKQLATSEMRPGLLRQAKDYGLSDARIAALAGCSETDIRQRRMELSIRPVYKSVDTCAAEFEAKTPYFYSSYDTEDERPSWDRRTVAVVGSGPIRIGQGIEFDYCSVHATAALLRRDMDAVMINSNPETVSTDFDSCSRLYFEPLDSESVAEIVEGEKAEGVIVQFGGQTAINLAHRLEKRGIAILGTEVASIKAAEDRKNFSALIQLLGLRQPEGAATTDPTEALRIGERIGYPLLVRPSYVLGGRAMELVRSPGALKVYLDAAFAAVPETTDGEDPVVLVDRYLLGTEVDVDAISDGETVVLPGLIEHVERAGVHSGDSMAAYPALHLSPRTQKAIVEATTSIALALGIKGLCNLQFVINDDKVNVIEVNPRASRTVPFLSKVSGVPMVDLAVRVMLGEKLADLGWSSGLLPPRGLVAIKAPVFSLTKLQQVDMALGPEMKSTGEVMGIDTEEEAALEKAFIAALGSIPRSGDVLLSLDDGDKTEALPIVRQLVELGFAMVATAGTRAFLAASGIDAKAVGKLEGDHPHVIDAIEAGGISLVVNTVSQSGDEPFAFRAVRDGYNIRQAAEKRRIPCCTSLDTARALVAAMIRQRDGAASHIAPVKLYRDAIEAVEILGSAVARV